MATKLDYEALRADALKQLGLDEKSYRLRLKAASNAAALKGGKSGTLVEGDTFKLPEAVEVNYLGEMPLGFRLQVMDSTDWVQVLCTKTGGTLYPVAGGRFARQPRKVGKDGKTIYDSTKGEYETHQLQGSFFVLYRHFAATAKFLAPTLFECAKWLESLNCSLKVGTPYDVQTTDYKGGTTFVTLYPIIVLDDNQNEMSDADVTALLA